MTMTIVKGGPFQVRMNETNTPIVVWCFKDGRRGHENQSLGLLEALADNRGLDIHDVTVEKRAFVDWWRAAAGRFPPGDELPAPVFHLGAGHGTHLPMLAAKRARGGKTIVLMNPSLPQTWFDLCIVPEHDDGKTSPNMLRTRGVLNRLRPHEDVSCAKGLILIGGPSTHYDWSDSKLRDQIDEITEDSHDIEWTLATSPRTPRTTTDRLRELTTAKIGLAPFETVNPAWLPDKLIESSRIWITEDSVSMVYEALTTGAAVGLIEVPQKKSSRVSRGIESLVADGLATPFSRWRSDRNLPKPHTPLHEASRCAEWIADRWL